MRAGVASLVSASLVLFAACGSSHDDAVTPPLADAGPEDASGVDAAYPILPYPAGPYGGGVGDVLPNFTVQGYAMSRAERDSRKLPWRDISLAEARSLPGCECLVIAFTAAGTQCGPCVDEDQALSGAMAAEPSICALEAIATTYDGSIQLPDIDAGLVQGPQVPTRADIDALTRANRESYPVGIVTTSSTDALSARLQPLIPQNYVVRTSDMRVMGLLGGSDGSAPSKILPLCHHAHAPVETLASADHPRSIALGAAIYVGDAGGVLAVPRGEAGSATRLVALGTTPVSLALDGGFLTYATGEGAPPFEVGRVDLASGARTSLATSSAAYTSVAVDGLYVYFTCSDGTVGRVAKAGGAITTLASGEASPSHVVVDATDVYWLDAATGEVGRMPKGGGARASFVPAGSIHISGFTLSIASILDGGTDLYVDAGAPAGLLYRVPKATGETILVLQLGSASDLVAAIPGGAFAVGSSDASLGPALINYVAPPGTFSSSRLSVVTPGQRGLRALAADDTEIDWVVDDASTGAVRRIQLGVTP